MCYPLAAAMTIVSCGSTSPLAPSAGAPAAVPRDVVVLGDSLAVSPRIDQSFPAVLQRRIDRDSLPWTVINAGVSGDTTADGLRRVDAVLNDRVGVLVLALGANDGLRGVSVAAVEQNLSSIIERARARRIAVLLCGMETPPAHGWEYTLDFHRLFPRLAANYEIPLVPFLLQDVALVPDMNGPDGIHPNVSGAQRIAETLWPYLAPMLNRSVEVVAGRR
jgi:acyl-CoA thioesterase-1